MSTKLGEDYPATAIAGYYGANYHEKTSTGGIAFWRPNIPVAGIYQVYARWVAASNHHSNARYGISNGVGTQIVWVDQRLNGGQWRLLGSYSLAAGSINSVSLDNQVKGTLIADAVKLVFTGAEQVHTLHTDHLNTPRLATDATGAVVWRWNGSAFGDTAPSGSATINLRFPGQLYDAESGLHYNWNRYYDPKTGRYVTSDPIGLSGGLNTYAYVLNNPLRWIDPTGESAIIVPRPIPFPGIIPRPIPAPIDPVLPVPPGTIPKDDTQSYCTRLYVRCVQENWGGDWSCGQCHFFCTGINQVWPFEHCSPDLRACRP